jgi:hypothetical protein
LRRGLLAAALAVAGSHASHAAGRQDIRPLLREALGAPADSMDAVIALIGAALGCSPPRCRVTAPLRGGGIELDTATDTNPPRPVEAVILVPCDGKIQLASDALWLGPHDAARTTSGWVKDLQTEFGVPAVQNQADGYGLYWTAPIAEGSRIEVVLQPGGHDPPPRGETLRASWAARSGPDDLSRCKENAAN